MTFAVGSLVKARGREWVVLPQSEPDLLMLRPLGGSEEEVTGIYVPLESVEHARFDLPDPARLGDFRSCRLLRDALRLGFRSSAGPFRSFAHLAIEPRPYQLVPLLMALKLDPIRILIADDVGIGKTVEAALIARELLDRGEVTRLAVLCPPQLAEQWQRELRDKFNIDAELVLPGTATRLERGLPLGESLFEHHPFVIVSLDFIKSDRRRDEFLRTCPELVIVDEAHRLNERSCRYNYGENQIKEIISASKFSVFFIDEDQKVTLKDIGDKETIRSWAKKLKAKVAELKLESQFRCNGSDGYLAWLDNTLQIRETANDKLKANDYDFRIVDSPIELHNIIREKNKEKNKARLVAGYCWKWISKRNPQLKDIVINDYRATWNLDTDGQAWLIKPDSVSEVGCIHTCQGLELDYVGVIVGTDLIVRNGKIITQPQERASTDRSIHTWQTLIKKEPEVTKERLDAIIKNTYRTLMTRGQKGCYVYFVDDETRQYFEKCMESSSVNDKVNIAKSLKEELQTTVVLPFRHLTPGEVRPFENCVPLYDLKVAAGKFSNEQQVTDIFGGLSEQSINDNEWVQLPDAFRHQRGLFVAQVVGESMNRRIPNGSWCLFRLNPTGTRQGKIVLAQHRGIADTDNGGEFTVKKYESKKRSLPDGTWRHTSIILRPDTTAPGYEPLSFTEEKVEDLIVVAELVAVLG